MDEYLCDSVLQSNLFNNSRNTEPTAQKENIQPKKTKESRNIHLEADNIQMFSAGSTGGFDFTLGKGLKEENSKARFNE